MNKNSKRYRFYEMIPGLFAWFVILFPIWGSFVVPKAVAYFVFAFLVYWLFQSFKAAILALIGYRKIKSATATNWLSRFNDDFRADWLKYRDINHVIIISSYKEPPQVIEMAFSSLAAQIDIDLKKIHVVLAQEERAGADNNQATIDYFQNKYAHTFGSLTFTEHPANIPGEIAGKHTNEAWAARYFEKHFFGPKVPASRRLKIEHCTLTSCDVDTIFNPKYFSACLLLCLQSRSLSSSFGSHLFFGIIISIVFRLPFVSLVPWAMLSILPIFRSPTVSFLIILAIPPLIN